MLDYDNREPNLRWDILVLQDTLLKTHCSQIILKMAEASPQEAKKKDANKGGKEKNTATLSKLSNAIKGSEKLDVEGTDLLELLSHLEGELQARDVAIAALKSEQTKRILYGCSQGTDHPCSPLTALNRDKHTRKDASQLDDEIRGSTLLAESQISGRANLIG